MDLDDAERAGIERARRTALAEDPAVKYAQAEGHTVEVVTVASGFEHSPEVTVAHTCPSKVMGRRVTLGVSDDSKFKVGRIEVTTRTFAGYCKRCHTLVAAVVVLEMRINRP